MTFTFDNKNLWIRYFIYQLIFLVNPAAPVAVVSVRDLGVLKSRFLSESLFLISISVMYQQQILINFKQKNMEVITILKDETNNRRLMQIDLNELAKDKELLEDIYDIIAIELRKEEETIPWEEVKKQLKAEGKL